MDDETAELWISVSSVADFLSYFIFYPKNYQMSYIGKFCELSALYKKCAMNIWSHDVGLDFF